MQQSIHQGKRNNTRIRAEGGLGVQGEYERKKENKGNEGRGNENDEKERNITRSFISFSSEKEVEEPWPLPLLSLGDVTMDLD